MSRFGARDTAKDIIMGTAPSGNGPRAPKDIRFQQPPDPGLRGNVNQQGFGGGGASPRANAPQTARPSPSLDSFSSNSSNSSNSIPQAPLPPLQNGPIGTSDPELAARLSSAERTNKNLMEELMKTQNAFRSFQRQHEDNLQQEQESRRRLEAQVRSHNDGLGRIADRLKSTENSVSSIPNQELEEHKRNRAQLEATVIRMQQDIAHMKGVVDRQQNDIMTLNNDIRNRPVVDPSKMNNTQHLDSGIRDLHTQVMQVRQMVDAEVGDRRRVDQEQAMNLNKLEMAVADQEARRNEILQKLAMNDNNKNAMSEEARRLNDKIALITDEVTRNMMAKEQSIRDENNQKYLVLEKAIKAELEARLQYERDVRQYLEGRWKQYAEELDAIKVSQQNERIKQKDRIGKMNEALAVLERQMEQGNKKMDRVMAAEIQSRKLHEKGLLAKLNDIEDRLGGHMGSLNRALDDVRRDASSKPDVPTIDHDAIRRDMEAIANDKHKLSMEGLVKLEDKMDRIQKGVDRDNNELKNKLDHIEATKAEAAPSGKGASSGGGIDDDTAARIRHQLNKLEETQRELEKSHEKMKDKVDKTIPADLNELSLKVDNNKKTLSDKLDTEERERYLSVKELQEEVVKLKNRPSRGIIAGDNNAGPSNEVTKYKNDKIEKDVEECQVGIKKLAESVTTVKNVLERKITEEAKTRERDVDNLNDEVEKLKKK